VGEIVRSEKSVRVPVPARVVCPLSFPGMRCLRQSSVLIPLSTRSGPRAELDGLLVHAPHWQDPGSGCPLEMVVAICPPACHNGRRSSCNVDLPAGFRAAHPSLFRRLEVGSVKACFLTMRAPDKWESARLQAFFLASSFFYPARCLPSAHLQVTLAVGQPKSVTG
jgi:hypothetical protein